MREVAKPGDVGKWETVRRLRYGDLLKLIRHRYGANGVPDDDAGRPDLLELLYLASMAPAGAEKKARNNIELYAPWMQTDEVEALIQHLSLEAKEVVLARTTTSYRDTANHLGGIGCSPRRQRGQKLGRLDREKGQELIPCPDRDSEFAWKGLKLDLNKLRRQGLVKPGAKQWAVIRWTYTYTGEEIAKGTITSNMEGKHEGWLRNPT